MASVLKTVISASRRTDIPAFYMEWFMDGIRKGYFEVVNPYTKKKFYVDAGIDTVHTIVFWSKNYNLFLNGGYGESLLEKGYNLFFNFTINSFNTALEPNVPRLTDRLDQMRELCLRFNPKTVQWRFDPVCFYKDSKGQEKNNLNDFETIAERAGDYGIERCITSFVDLYPKVVKRSQRFGDISFFDPAIYEKVNILLEMEKRLHERSISLFTCCEREALDMLPSESTITKSACIPNDYLARLYGGKISLAKDRGQRVKAGCGCFQSSDIGSYSLHPCFHNCVFCYANPAL